MGAGHDYAVLSTRDVFQGRVLAVRSDVVAMPGGTSSQRDVVELPGAVAIVALDDDNNVALVHQYRHPVRRHLWELPAGLLDSTDETALEAAQRELAEEIGVVALRWETAVDMLTSPGMSDETIRVLFAWDIAQVPASQRHVPFDEEAEMVVRWVPLQEALDAVLTGRIENGITIAGLLAAALRTGLVPTADQRPAGAAWPARKGQQTTESVQVTW